MAKLLTIWHVFAVQF